MFNRAVKGADLIPITETGDLNVCESTDPYILPFPCAVGLTPHFAKHPKPCQRNHLSNLHIYLHYAPTLTSETNDSKEPEHRKNTEAIK